VIPVFFFQCRLGLRWPLLLPISTRKLFWAMWLPITTVLGAGVLLNFPFEMDLTKRPEVSPKAHMTALAAVVLFWLLQICALQLYGWKKLQCTSPTFRIILSGAPSFLAYAAYMTPMFLHWAGMAPRDLDPIFDALVRNLASVLPDNLWMIALIAALPAAGLYWLAEKLFREMEFGQIEIARHGGQV
jgi:hypothetical protein